MVLCVAVGVSFAGAEPFPIEIVDPNPTLLSETGELTAPETLERMDAFAGALPQRTGVAVDGVSVLLLRARASNAVTFSLSPALGTLRALESGATNAHTVTVTPKVASDGSSFVFALYIPPNDLRGGSLRKSITISLRDGTRTGSAALRLETPPVILVHGVWSDDSTWNGLREFLMARGFRFCEETECIVNYGPVQPAPSFDPLSVDAGAHFAVDQLIQATTNSLNARRSEGIAATQVDVVAHSLGGLIARARMVQPDVSRAYRRRENFGHGDFHKLITIGTPHFGTPVANFLITNRQVRSQFFDGATLQEYLAATGHPVGPAIEQMQTNTAALAHLGTTDVASHAIVGIAPARSHTEELLDMLPGALGYFLSFDSLLGGNGNHDVLVPRDSQAGGLPRAAVTLVRGTVHADLDGRDTGETESHAIWRRVAKLLVTPGESKRFGNFLASPGQETPAAPVVLRMPVMAPIPNIDTDAAASLLSRGK